MTCRIVHPIRPLRQQGTGLNSRSSQSRHFRQDIMDRMYDHGVRWVYHLARIVPAGSMYASATMLNFRLQGADEGLHLTLVFQGRICVNGLERSSANRKLTRCRIWMMFVVSAGLLALTQHRTYSAYAYHAPC